MPDDDIDLPGAGRRGEKAPPARNDACNVCGRIDWALDERGGSVTKLRCRHCGNTRDFDGEELVP